MDIQNKILRSLNELENCLKCSICDENCKVPVRIKTCGHYFCQLCLKKRDSDKKCPKCGSFYIAKDIDNNNIARQYNSHFHEVRALLEMNTSITNDRSVKKLSVTETKKVDTYMFVYSNKKYCVNFMLVSTKKNPKGETPLHLACKKCKVSEVKKLLGQKVDINAKDYAGWSPLVSKIFVIC